MQKDRVYHEAAIQYNEELAQFAEGLSERLEHEEVARWAKSVAKQHHFHAGRHTKALEKLDRQRDRETVETEDGGEDRAVSPPVPMPPPAQGDAADPFKVVPSSGEEA